MISTGCLIHEQIQNTVIHLEILDYSRSRSHLGCSSVVRRMEALRLGSALPVFSFLITGEYNNLPLVL